MKGLLQRNAFAFLRTKDIEENANILGGGFILVVKQPCTETER